MMRVLIAKELRGLRPVAICIVGFIVLINLFLLATKMPDKQLLDPAQWSRDSGPMVMVLALLGMMIGGGVLINESDQGTLGFIDGLPLSRTRLFIAKVIAAFAVSAFGILIDFPFTLFFDWLSRNSVDGPFPWPFVLAWKGMAICAGGFLLALAMALSFTRNWFVFIAGLVLWGYLWLRQQGLHHFALFDPVKLLAGLLDGDRVSIPWGHVAALGAATLVLLVGAWAGFLSLGDRVQFAAQRMRKWRLLRVLGIGLPWFAPVVWIAAIIHFAGNHKDKKADNHSHPLGEKSFRSYETAHYEFIFREAQHEQAQPLMDAADAVHNQVTGFFDTTPTAARILVDLDSPVMSHAAGMANWTKIRMRLSPGLELDKLRRTLGHETAHVYISQLGEGRLETHFSAIRFLHEGLATHVENHYFSTDVQRARGRRSVAAVWERGRVPFELLCDDTKLSHIRDPNLVYPLGEVFARVLVKTHGPASPARLLRAFGRSNAPVGLTGTALWRDAAQAAAIDLERVVAAYEEACAQIARDESAFLARLPRLSATVSIEGAEVVITPKFEGAAAGVMVCCIESDGPFLTEVLKLETRADGCFVLPRDRLTKPTIRYLLGWSTPEIDYPVFEPWAQAKP
jgi:hypothetical protein